MNKKILKKIAFTIMASILLISGEGLISSTSNIVIAQAAGSYEVETVSWEGNTPYFTRIYKERNWPKSFRYTADNDKGWTCSGTAYVDSWAVRDSGWYKGYYTVVYKGITTRVVD